jgi:hypothetical protein
MFDPDWSVVFCSFTSADSCMDLVCTSVQLGAFHRGILLLCKYIFLYDYVSICNRFTLSKCLWSWAHTCLLLFSGITELCYKNWIFPRTNYYRPQEESYCHRKKLPVKGINFLQQEESSSQGKDYLWQEETSCHSKKPPSTGRNLLSHEEAFKD